VTDLAPLKGMPALQTLYLHDTKVTDLAPLKGMPALKKVILDDQNAKDAETISELRSRGVEVSRF
jgi:hypothetical protein